MPATSEASPFWRMADVTGNPVTVDIITSGAARVTVHDDNDQPTGSMLLTADDAQQLADAVRRACA